MLKFNYAKQGTILESLADSIEEVINRRVLLAIRTAQPIHLEPSFVSLIVPAGTPELRALETELAQGDCTAVSVCTTITNSPIVQGPAATKDMPSRDIEVIMHGVWLTHHLDAEEGLFLTSLTSEIEEQIEELWSYQPISP